MASVEAAMGMAGSDNAAPSPVRRPGPHERRDGNATELLSACC